MQLKQNTMKYAVYWMLKKNSKTATYVVYSPYEVTQ